MYPTADTLPLIRRNLVGGRVMPGVSCFLLFDANE